MDTQWYKTANILPENGKEVIFRDFSGKGFRGIFRNYGNGSVYVGTHHVCVCHEWKYV